MYPYLKWIGTISSYIQTKLGRIVIMSITLLLTLFTSMHCKYILIYIANIATYIKLDVGISVLWNS